jgi:DNA-binding NarL/FixJ family response regulator
MRPYVSDENSMETEAVVTQSTIYAVISDARLRDAINTNLGQQYHFSYDGDIEQLEQRTAVAEPNLILCHQSLLEENQSIGLARLKAASPNALILVIGPSRPIEMQIKALKYGARGYFDVVLPIERLATAIEAVLHGEVWIERHVISGLIDELVQVPEINQQQRMAVESLSPKELEVAKLVSHGATNKMIANKLAITERTVKAHLTAIFHKMDIPDRLSLAIFFRDLR